MPASDPRMQLLASIHDVSPRFESAIDALYDRITMLLGGPRLAMLVVPDFWDEAPLAAAPGFARKLRSWSDAGVEMFVHGWSHRDDQRHSGLTSFKARWMTAREGEFLGLDRREAGQRMARGKAVVEDIIGRSAAGFVAPAWLYGDGARAALRDLGFALAEDHLRVWRPKDGARLAHGPVITWASRSRARVASSLAFAALAPALLRRQPVVRAAVHPGDTAVPAVLDSIDRTFSRLLADREPGRYADLVPAAPSHAAAA
ncbi:MAG: hypothetical protein JWN69_151 [Alphaproteobacteria bacterium]|nr:hypothetical protein [Alphaproteobacteria bacterium]